MCRSLSALSDRRWRAEGGVEGVVGDGSITRASTMGDGWNSQSTAPDRVHGTMNKRPARSSTCKSAPHACHLRAAVSCRRIPPPPKLTIYPNSNPIINQPVRPLKTVVTSQPPLAQPPSTRAEASSRRTLQDSQHQVITRLAGRLRMDFDSPSSEVGGIWVLQSALVTKPRYAHPARN